MLLLSRGMSARLCGIFNYLLLHRRVSIPIHDCVCIAIHWNFLYDVTFNTSALVPFQCVGAVVTEKENSNKKCSNVRQQSLVTTSSCWMSKNGFMCERGVWPYVFNIHSAIFIFFFIVLTGPDKTRANQNNVDKWCDDMCAHHAIHLQTKFHVHSNHRQRIRADQPGMRAMHGDKCSLATTTTLW